MEFKNVGVSTQPEILKRKLGSELFVPVTITVDADVVKAGSPIDTNGAIANDGTAVGILLNDVYPKKNPNGSLIKGFATVNEAVANANAGITIAEAVKTALPNIIFE